MVSNITAYDTLKIILMSLLMMQQQGGGYEKQIYDENPPIFTSISMEAVVSKVEMPVVHPKGLKEIPCLRTVTQAISMLCKKEEVSIDNFVYIKFPFGMIDYNGLKQLQLYHFDLNRKHDKEKIQTWLSECGSIHGINMKKIKEFFSQSKLENEKVLVNLTGDRWVTDNEIEQVFSILNKQYDDVMCVVCTPDNHVSDFLKTKSKDFTSGKILLALNVGQDHKSKTVFIADGIRQGNHWTLLALDTEQKVAYYGDSLRWDTPENLLHRVEPLLSKLRIQFKAYKILPIPSMKKEPVNIYPFYPTQACSNVCGVIVLCMAAVMCCNWQCWQSWNDTTAPQCLSKPSLYSKHLRLSAISWILEEEIHTDGIIRDFKQIPQGVQNCKKLTFQSDSDSDNCYSTNNSAHETFITAILPSEYEYNFLK